jgi:conjugative transposon TraM protein
MKEDKEVDIAQKPPLTAEQKIRQKKMLVFPLMFIVFGLCMWLIFAPPTSDKAKEQKGFNTDIPLPKSNALVKDKKEAYEQAKLEERNKERMHSLQDLSSMFSTEMKESNSYDLKTETTAEVPTTKDRKAVGSKQPFATIRTSNNAYREMNRNLGSFYNSSKNDPEKEKLTQKVQELSAQLQETENRKSTVGEQLELMEKSYQMAAKYMPQGQSQLPLPSGQSTKVAPNSEVTPTVAKNSNQKLQLTAVKQVQEHTVSTLAQEISDSAFIVSSSVPRNVGFNTAIGSSSTQDKNTIKACVHENCTLITGQSVRLRLLEPLQAGTTLIPRNSILSGEAKIQADRLKIAIKSLEFRGSIIPVQLMVYDIDGQKGIFIPGSMEMSAVKEMAANMGSSMGTSISISQSAGQQIASDLGKGVIQSGSQYLSKKFQQVKVKLKAGYTVLLLPNID